jgi:hypothetical protein
MGFKSRFPFFTRDEVTPDEIVDEPDIDKNFGRVIARVQAWSNILGISKFLRSDYNGRLHVTETPTDFENINSGTYTTIVGNSVMLPANPDRQIVYLANIAGFSVDVYLVVNGVNVFFMGLLAGDIAIFSGFTQALSVTSATAGGSIRFFEV